ncbi:hypothetical protein [Vibrio crassostreae]|uniref:hypothetical protein n=1 Tax=Vibrio crassostreae TaxID=246167 RepID=UPI001B3117EB|nr:hypothetical protein [Vibrio crassostreae]
MTIMDGQRAKPEPQLVSITDTFYSKDGAELFCVMSESVSNITGLRTFTCEEVESGRTVQMQQSVIVELNEHYQKKQ